MRRAINSLEHLLVIYVSVGLLCFSLLMGIFTYYNAFRHQLRSSENLQGQLIRTVQSQAEVAAFARNSEIADEILTGLLTNPLFLGIRIESEDGFSTQKFQDDLTIKEGNVAGSRSDILRINAQKGDFSRGSIYPLFSPVNEGEHIGALIVLQDKKQIRKEARDRSFSQAGTMLLQLLAASFLITWFSRRIITGPVAGFTAAVANIKPDSGVRLTIDPNNANNEIGRLSRSINALLETVEQALAESADARQSAEEATKAKSRFLANMSHEVRTPMNAIMGFAGLALKTELNAQQRDYVSKIDLSARTLLGIINDILDFTKIEADKLDLERVPFQLGGLLENLISMVSIQAEKKGIELNYSLAQDVPNDIMGDPLRLNQILINLTNNAVKFTESGQITITTSLQSQTRKCCILQFAVSDTGIGMTEGEMEHLFEAFSQGDSSISRKFGGTGLGLSISKRLVEMMGGEISVSSKPGVGTTFTFSVAMGLAAADVYETTQKVSPERYHSIIPSAFRNMSQSFNRYDPSWHREVGGANILLVEDNRINQQVAMEILIDAGAVVSVANNGREAVDAVERQQFDIILMDIQMPVMDGYEATALIREKESFKKTPVIAMTAHAMAGAKQQCLDHGMDDYVSKPIDNDLLIATLKRWVTLSTTKQNSSKLTQAPAIQGVDLQKAMVRLNGNLSLFFELLNRFVQDYDTFPKILSRLLENGELKKAEKIVHTLKGTAGNLSAYLLQQTAMDLEALIREQKEHSDRTDDSDTFHGRRDNGGDGEGVDKAITSLLSDFELFMNPVKEFVNVEREKKGFQEELLKQPIEKSGVSGIFQESSGEDKEKISTTINELAYALARNDSDAAHYFVTLKSLIVAPSLRTPLERMETHINNFDFDVALSPLQKIAESLNIPLDGV